MSLAIGAAASAERQIEDADYAFVIDKSGSMMMTDMRGGQTRWNAVAESVYAIAAHVFRLDPDGLDIWVFSGHHKLYPNVRPEKVHQVFQENLPYGPTNLTDVLQAAVDRYFAKRDAGQVKKNGEVLIVVTDGQPDDKNGVTRVITNTVSKLRPEDNLAIQFVQVGKDRDASQFLRYLDTQLVVNHQAWRDIVGTIKVEEIEKHGLQQVLLDVITGARAPTASSMTSTSVLEPVQTSPLERKVAAA